MSRSASARPKIDTPGLPLASVIGSIAELAVADERARDPRAQQREVAGGLRRGGRPREVQRHPGVAAERLHAEELIEDRERQIDRAARRRAARAWSGGRWRAPRAASRSSRRTRRRGRASRSRPGTSRRSASRRCTCRGRPGRRTSRAGGTRVVRAVDAQRDVRVGVALDRELRRPGEQLRVIEPVERRPVLVDRRLRELDLDGVERALDRPPEAAQLRRLDPPPRERRASRCTRTRCPRAGAGAPSRSARRRARWWSSCGCRPRRRRPGCRSAAGCRCTARPRGSC